MTLPWSELLRYHAHPEVWALIVGAAGLYAVALRRHRGHTGRTPSGRHVARFLLGTALLWAALDWPIDDLSDGSLLSVHMVQYLLLAMLAPVLLLTGMPAWMIARVLRPRWPRWLATALARPWNAWLVVSAVVVASHLDPAVTLYLRSDAAHLAMHALWLGAGLVLWWPVVQPLPNLPRYGPPVQIGYLFLQSLVPIFPAAFLTFAQAPLFRAYAALPKPPGIDAVTDQQIAGVLMTLGGTAILWSAIAVIFFRWAHAQEEEVGASGRR